MVDLALLQSVSYIAGALGVCVAATYYVMNMRATLQTRQAQLFMTSMFEKLSSPEFAKASRTLEKNKPKTVQDLAHIFDDPELNAAWGTVWWVYEGLGVLIHEDLVDIRLVARYIGGTYKAVWEAWGPVFKLAKVEWNHPRMADESEYLYDRLMDFGRKNLEYHIIESKYSR